MAVEWKDVALLITHYNRSNSLERLLRTFQDLDCAFGEIVVSDDGSSSEHLDKIRDLQATYPFKLVTTEKNRGLGNNINKGQDQVTAPVTLYVQEDFEPTASFPVHFKDALGLFEENKELDIVRLYSYVRYPYLLPFKKGFSVMLYKPWYWDYMKIYYYSDHPHLRRSTFFQKFGRYKEGVPGDRGEYQMCVSFLRNKGKGLFYDDFQSLFRHQNSNDEPSTMSRDWKQQSNNVFVKSARFVYRQVKYNFDLLFSGS